MSLDQQALGAAPAAALPAGFGGTALVSHGTVLDVYLTDVTAAAENQVFSALSDSLSPNAVTPTTSNVQFVQTPNSLTSLLAVNTEIGQDYPALTAEGIDIVSSMPDIWIGQEYVQLYNGTAAQAQTLENEFGSGLLDVSDTSSPTVAATANRSSDTAPYNGGDFSDSPQGATDYDCTTGWPVHDQYGTPFLLEAGHCFLDNWEVYNYSAIAAYNGQPSGTISNSTEIGTVVDRDTSGGGLDTELIQTNDSLAASEAIWIGSSQSPVPATISTTIATLQAGMGEEACVDGAFEGQDCNMEVIGTQGCQYIPNEPAYPSTNREVCAEQLLADAHGTIAVGAGDSGSPVYTYDDPQGSLEGVGIENAAPTDAELNCTAYPNYSNSSGVKTARACYIEAYYVNLNNIVTHYSSAFNENLTLGN